MVFYLGIDGGGSGCRAVLADSAGQRIGQGAGGPANINTDVDGAAASILQAAQQAMQGSDAAPEQLVATLGLAGGEMRGKTEKLAGMLPFARVQIVNDAITSARGALGRADGILAAIGTGSVYALQRAGRIGQRGGRGFLLGDQASGAVMGRALMVQALRAADGFAPMTPLLGRILCEYGGTEGIIEFGNSARPADFGALSPQVTGSDDPAARDIVDRAVAEIRHVLTTLQDGAALPVVFTGGLGAFFAERLSAEFPLQQAAGSSVDGALDMARQMAEAA